MGRKKVLPSCSLTRLASLFLSFKFGQWKSTQANKDGSQSPNLGNWTVILCGGFMGKKIGGFTSLWSTSHSLSQKLQYWFNFTLIYVTAPLPRPSMVSSISFFKKKNACRQLSQGNKTAFTIHFHFFYDKFSCVSFMVFLSLVTWVTFV